MSEEIRNKLGLSQDHIYSDFDAETLPRLEMWQGYVETAVGDTDLRRSIPLSSKEYRSLNELFEADCSAIERSLSTDDIDSFIHPLGPTVRVRSNQPASSMYILDTSFDSQGKPIVDASIMEEEGLIAHLDDPQPDRAIATSAATGCPSILLDTSVPEELNVLEQLRVDAGAPGVTASTASIAASASSQQQQTHERAVEQEQEDDEVVFMATMGDPRAADDDDDEVEVGTVDDEPVRLSSASSSVTTSEAYDSLAQDRQVLLIQQQPSRRPSIPLHAAAETKLAEAAEDLGTVSGRPNSMTPSPVWEASTAVGVTGAADPDSDDGGDGGAVGVTETDAAHATDTNGAGGGTGSTPSRPSRTSSPAAASDGAAAAPDETQTQAPPHDSHPSSQPEAQSQVGVFQPPPVNTLVQEQESASMWRSATTNDGRLYYYNRLTRKSTWQLPAGVKGPIRHRGPHRSAAGTAATTATTTTSSSSSSKPSASSTTAAGATTTVSAAATRHQPPGSAASPAVGLRSGGKADQASPATHTRTTSRNPNPLHSPSATHGIQHSHSHPSIRTPNSGVAAAGTPPPGSLRLLKKKLQTRRARTPSSRGDSPDSSSAARPSAAGPPSASSFSPSIPHSVSASALPKPSVSTAAASSKSFREQPLVHPVPAAELFTDVTDAVHPLFVSRAGATSIASPSSASSRIPMLAHRPQGSSPPVYTPSALLQRLNAAAKSQHIAIKPPRLSAPTIPVSSILADCAGDLPKHLLRRQLQPPPQMLDDASSSSSSSSPPRGAAPTSSSSSSSSSPTSSSASSSFASSSSDTSSSPSSSSSSPSVPSSTHHRSSHEFPSSTENAMARRSSSTRQPSTTLHAALHAVTPQAQIPLLLANPKSTSSDPFASMFAASRTAAPPTVHAAMPDSVMSTAHSGAAAVTAAAAETVTAATTVAPVRGAEATAVRATGGSPVGKFLPDSSFEDSFSDDYEEEEEEGDVGAAYASSAPAYVPVETEAPTHSHVHHTHHHPHPQESSAAARRPSSSPSPACVACPFCESQVIRQDLSGHLLSCQSLIESRVAYREGKENSFLASPPFDLSTLGTSDPRRALRFGRT